jgi:serpin B
MIDVGISESINRFGMELYALLRGRAGTLFFSPPSIATTFAMALAGARGRSAEEMAAVLRAPRDREMLHEGLLALLEEIGATEQRRGYLLSHILALCPTAGTGLQDDYRKLLDRYGALSSEYEFSTATEASREAINDWASEKTHGKIRELLEPGTLGSDTRLLLCGGIYFRGQWTSQFLRTRTQDSEFRVSRDYAVSVPMMQQQERFNFFDGPGFSGLELPYLGYDFSLMLFLPHESEGLLELEKTLSPENLTKWLLEFRARQVSVWLPRLRLESSIEMTRVLSDLGMPLAFTAEADFSGINGKPHDLYLAPALHRSLFHVNEEGKEAAAATNPPIMQVPQPVAPASFRADHPFFFFVRHNPTGMILLMGRITNPRESLVSLLG